MKKGFTLIELLAVITVIALLSIMFLPDIMEKLNEALDKSMTITENQLLDATNLYIEDNCRNPIGGEDNRQCFFSRRIISDNQVYFCIYSVQTDEIYYNDETKCNGIVVYDNESQTSLYKNGKTYLICGEEYITKGAELYQSLIENCKNGGGIFEPRP